MQRDFTVHPTLLERGGFWISAGVGRSRKFEAKANISNKKLKFLHCAVKII